MTEPRDPMLGTPADGRHPDHACGQLPCPHVPSVRPAWVKVGEYCECRHPKYDHGTAGQECAYGWTGEPDEDEPCACLGYVYAGDDVVPVRLTGARP